MSLQGRHAVVTGAGSGMGRATAERLAEAGCQVTVMGRHLGRLNETVDRIGDAAFAAPADVTDPDARLREATEQGLLSIQLEALVSGLDGVKSEVRVLVGSPADELAAFGVDRALLKWCHDNQRTDPRVRQALEDQHATTRAIYRTAYKGIALLAPESRPCVTAAFTLYSEILDRIEAIGFAVFSQRASVGVGRRLQVFTSGLIRAKRARRSRPGPRGSITQGAA